MDRKGQTYVVRQTVRQTVSQTDRQTIQLSIYQVTHHCTYTMPSIQHSPSTHMPARSDAHKDTPGNTAGRYVEVSFVQNIETGFEHRTLK